MHIPLADFLKFIEANDLLELLNKNWPTRLNNIVINEALEGVYKDLHRMS